MLRYQFNRYGRFFFVRTKDNEPTGFIKLKEKKEMDFIKLSM